MAPAQISLDSDIRKLTLLSRRRRRNFFADMPVQVLLDILKHTDCAGAKSIMILCPFMRQYAKVFACSPDIEAYFFEVAGLVAEELPSHLNEIDPNMVKLPLITFFEISGESLLLNTVINLRKFSRFFNSLTFVHMYTRNGALGGQSKEWWLFLKFLEHVGSKVRVEDYSVMPLRPGEKMGFWTYAATQNSLLSTQNLDLTMIQVLKLEDLHVPVTDLILPNALSMLVRFSDGMITRPGFKNIDAPRASTFRILFRSRVPFFNNVLVGHGIQPIGHTGTDFILSDTRGTAFNTTECLTSLTTCDELMGSDLRFLKNFERVSLIGVHDEFLNLLGELSHCHYFHWRRCCTFPDEPSSRPRVSLSCRFASLYLETTIPNTIIPTFTGFFCASLVVIDNAGGLEMRGFLPDIVTQRLTYRGEFHDFYDVIIAGRHEHPIVLESSDIACLSSRSSTILIGVSVMTVDPVRLATPTLLVGMCGTGVEGSAENLGSQPSSSLVFDLDHTQIREMLLMSGVRGLVEPPFVLGITGTFASSTLRTLRLLRSDGLSHTSTNIAESVGTDMIRISNGELLASDNQNIDFSSDLLNFCSDHGAQLTPANLRN